ncbi:hypothetical protein [Herminiimonas contaminans]|uniref:Uncharacterized protein n=1 Tax=Herminiimonas contaminans TaxID=1111140 RepID=A0ABS0ESE2_9BURK|nr:hypothetical protein [Herminiimonas contaminans]MBF8177620.1 hypothetical protein [Herminiimonas contaminans]
MKATIRLTGTGFRAALEDGRQFEREGIEDLAKDIFNAGITFNEAFCGDWRDGDDILMIGSQIALKAELRRLEKD